MKLLWFHTARGLACIAATLALAAIFCRAEARYPGPPPGPAVARVSHGSLFIGNQALSAVLATPPKGLGSLSVRNERTKHSIALGRDVFRIVLPDGRQYGSSEMLMEGTPGIRKLGADTGSSGPVNKRPGCQIEIPLRSPDGIMRVSWRAVMFDGSNYLRQEVDLRGVDREIRIAGITWLDGPVPDVRRLGKVDGSVLTAGDLFFGCEDPMADNNVLESNRAVSRLECPAILQPGESFARSFVIGVAPAGQLRRAFLFYIERERAHPYRPFLHYNSWYDISWQPFALNEKNCLDAIRSFGDSFIESYGVQVDAMVFDDGWDDPETLWKFHSGFPKGFAPLADLARRYHTHLGTWLSPFGGYGEARKQRLLSGGRQGYETNPSGFSLAGPKYYAAFKAACVNMIRSYGVNHFKFDGIASGTYANGSGQDYQRDIEAMRRLMLELRKESPDLYINLTTGSWPSPFWLRYADSVWRQGGDMGFAGKGNLQQQWLTYRDRETFRNIVGKGVLFPLNSLMTQGVAYSRQGNAGRPEFNSAGFKDDVRAFFGSGTGLQELYIQPGKLTSADWQVLAEAAKWSRANADVLVDTHWIGGDPGLLEVYGFASWTQRKGIVMLRNPDAAAREFTLEIQSAFELPADAPVKYTARSPWKEDAQQPSTILEAGRPLRLELKPFQVLILEAIPAP